MNMKQVLIERYESLGESQFEACEGARIMNVLQKRYNTPRLMVRCWPDDAPNPYIEYDGFDIDNANLALCNAYQLADYAHQKQSWHLIEVDKDGCECGIVDSKTIPAINETTEDIMHAVQKHFGGKYTSHDTENGEYIKLRIADHSGKHANNGTGKCISIVIANDNVTAHFRSAGPEGIDNEHYYDDDYTVNEIIEAINTLLLEEGVILQDT